MLRPGVPSRPRPPFWSEGISKLADSPQAPAGSYPIPPSTARRGTPGEITGRLRNWRRVIRCQVRSSSPISKSDLQIRSPSPISWVLRACVLLESQQTPGRFKLAVVDFTTAMTLWPLWTTLAWNDILHRYRRSALGPFWLTASMAISIIALGTVYSEILKLPAAPYWAGCLRAKAG